jgi:membrane-associated phospholipid phosphatase
VSESLPSTATARFRVSLHVLGLGLMLALAGLSLYAWGTDQPAWEVDLVRALQEEGPAWLRPVAVVLAFAGTGAPWAGLVGVIGLVLFLVAGLRATALLLVAAMLQDVGAAMKLLIERARPSDAYVAVWHRPDSYSFPSGHVLGATLVFGFLIVALEGTALRAPLKRAAQGACLAWMLLMGLGRMELGAHWPTDVIGAYLTGVLLLLPLVAMLRASRRAAAEPA